jgi:hypothetical protein
VLGGAVEPAQERDGQPQRLSRGVQQVGDLLFGVRPSLPMRPLLGVLFPL